MYAVFVETNESIDNVLKKSKSSASVVKVDKGYVIIGDFDENDISSYKYEAVTDGWEKRLKIQDDLL